MYHDAYQVYELLDKWNPHGPPDVTKVEGLFQRHPSAARQEFLFGQTLLHKCMEHYSNELALVQVLIQWYPEALRKQDDNGFLPIHRALIAGAGQPTVKLLRLLLNEAPETILETTPAGALPLHLACSRFESADMVAYLVECFPDCIQHRDNQGRFPLHYALEASRPQPIVVQRLLEHYPVLLSFLDDEGYLPLHRVLLKTRPLYDSIVELLVEYCPGALRVQELQNGQTPLLLACQNNNPISQIYSLVRAWPEQIQVGSSAFETEVFNGEMLPSALASQCASLERLLAWMERYPSAVQEQDSQGRLPIHYAALSQSKDAPAMVQQLIDTCRVADRHGRLPLHYAAAAGNRVIVEQLVDKYPDGLLQEDKDGRQPWHYAECARMDGVYDQTLDLADGEIGELELVPDEVRWDVLQIVPESWY